MEHLTPQIIAGETGGKYIGEEESRDIHVTGAVRDNRDVQPGSLFVCIQGAKVDGHTFANSAFEAGAACCLAEKPIPGATGPYILVDSTHDAIMALAAYYRGLFSIPVVGVTGSVGKTTSKELIAAALGAKYRVLKTISNQNNELGVSLLLLSLDERYDVAVVEMGISEHGEMSNLARMVRPDIFNMTSIGYSHIEALGDLNGVLRAKSEAFAHMKPESVAILNGDDDILCGYDPGIRKILCGLGERNDFRAENISSEGTQAVTCDVVNGMERLHVRIPAYGSHLASLAPAAVAIGRLLGLTSEEIHKGILSYAPVDGRANVIDTGYITLIDDCYNANPHSVEAAITSLCVLPGRRVAIVGDMLELSGLSDSLHREAGIFAARSGIDRIICCGDKAKLAYESYRSSCTGAASYYRDIAQLMTALPKLVKKGDYVLVKASHAMRFDKLIPLLRVLRSEI